MRAEQETLMRWDEEERVAHLCTTYPPLVRRWQRRGYPVRVLGRTVHGEPRSWEATVPVACISFRRLADVHRRTRTVTGVPILGEISRTDPRLEEGDRGTATSRLTCPDREGERVT
jgi:hypothetical protein